MKNAHFMGMNGYVWWIGIIENRIDPLKTGRCQVRIFGWNTENKSLQPTEDLIWAHPMLPLNNSDVTPPKEGTMVTGFFMDGEGAQHPIMIGQLPGIPDTKPDPSKGFSDPRTDQQLQTAPRPPQSVTQPNNGQGATVNEAPSAQRYPNVLNEPTTSRIARNENIENTIIQRKRNSYVDNIPVGTGGMTTNLPVDITALLRIQATLPSIRIPAITAGLNLNGGFELCGLGINVNLSAGISFGGFTIAAPQLQLDGSFLLGSISVNDLLALETALGLAALAIDVAGCILGGGKIGNNLVLPGGGIIPLLPPGITVSAGLSAVTRGSVIGGVSLGKIGNIPLTTQPYWNEPRTPYNAKYPYNKVHETESGHVFEVDDTPGAERIHNYHRSGTFDEIHPNGSKVTKIVNDHVQITLKDNNVMIMGDCNVTIKGKKTEYIQQERNTTIDQNDIFMLKGDSTSTILGSQNETIMKDVNTSIMQNNNVLVKGKNTVSVDGDFNVFAKGDANILVEGNAYIGVAGKLDMGVKGDATINFGGNLTSKVGGDVNLTAKNINFNADNIRMNENA